MLGGARWSAMLGGAKGTFTHVCARPVSYLIQMFSFITVTVSVFVKKNVGI